MPGPGRPADIVKLIEHLHQEGWMGWSHFRIWRQLLQYLSEQEQIHKNAPLFFSLTARAHFDEALLHLWRFLDDKSAGLPYFLKVAEQARNNFRHATADQVVGQVRADRRALKALCARAKPIIVSRHNKLAHFAQEHFTKPERLKGHFENIKPQEVEDLFSDLSKIVNVYDGWLRDSEMLWEIIGWDDFKNIGKLCERGREHRRQEIERLHRPQAR